MKVLKKSELCEEKPTPTPYSKYGDAEPGDLILGDGKNVRLVLKRTTAIGGRTDTTYYVYITSGFAADANAVCDRRNAVGLYPGMRIVKAKDVSLVLPD